MAKATADDWRPAVSHSGPKPGRHRTADTTGSPQWTPSQIPQPVPDTPGRGTCGQGVLPVLGSGQAGGASSLLKSMTRTPGSWSRWPARGLGMRVGGYRRHTLSRARWGANGNTDRSWRSTTRPHPTPGRPGRQSPRLRCVRQAVLNNKLLRGRSANGDRMWQQARAVTTPRPTSGRPRGPTAAHPMVPAVRSTAACTCTAVENAPPPARTVSLRPGVATWSRWPTSDRLVGLGLPTRGNGICGLGGITLHKKRTHQQGVRLRAEQQPDGVPNDRRRHFPQRARVRALQIGGAATPGGPGALEANSTGAARVPMRRRTDVTWSRRARPA